MRVLLLTQWFDPEPTFKGLLFAKELQCQGHQVEVLTGFPNYPGGVLYPGYRIRPYQREVVEGVVVHRVALFPSHDRSSARRIANYLSFAVSAALASALCSRPDVAYVYHPPGTIALPAWVLRVLRGVPVVYDVQDLWPDTLRATGMVTDRRVLGLVGWAMKRTYALATEIVVLSPGFARRLVERGVSPERVTVVPNWAAEDAITNDDPVLSRKELGIGDEFVVVFAGTMGPAQALGTILDAAEILREETRVRFLLVGAGVEAERLRDEAAGRGLSNVTFLPRRPPSEIGQVLAAADALLVHLRDDPLFAITIPSETQAYLMTGKPVLMGVRGDAANLAESAGAGLVFSPGQPQALVDAVQTLRGLSSADRARMGARGASYYREHLSLRIGARRIGALLERAARTRTRCERTKRAGDVVGAAAGLVALSVPMAVVALLVRSRLGRPVIFRQERPGRHGRPFTLLKFRTMTDVLGPDGEQRPDVERLTDLGRVLRLTSLDELPELVNVLKGEMSLVGPRPLLPQYSPYFTDRERRRLNVRPGITGLAQVSGRNEAGWSERLELDAWYVDHLSSWLDIKILARTLRNVVEREGVVVDPESMMQNLDDERRDLLGTES